MRFDFLTIFPGIFDSYLNESIIKRAIENKLIEVFVHDIRKFSKDRHHKVDAPPYGGGPGMVMTPQPLYDCIKHVKKLNKGPVIYLSAQGKILTQTRASSLANLGMPRAKQGPSAQCENEQTKNPRLGGVLSAASLQKKQGLILLCGHYEGIDQRVIDLLVDEELSIGKYVLTGGELAALVVLDVVSRFIPGVLGDETSIHEESFSKALKGKKEYPHYTRPPEFKGKEVPEVLRSGHHAAIKKWREEHLK